MLIIATDVPAAGLNHDTFIVFEFEGSFNVCVNAFVDGFDGSFTLSLFSNDSTAMCM